HFVRIDEAARESEAALGKFRRAFLEFFARAQNFHIALHVFMRPAARMRHIGKLRKKKAELGKEPEHLARDRLDIVLAANDDEAGYLVADQHVVARGNCVLHAITTRNNVLNRNKVAGFIIVGGQDNIQSVAGQMLGFFAELGFLFPQFPYVALWAGWPNETWSAMWKFCARAKNSRKARRNLPSAASLSRAA